MTNAKAVRWLGLICLVGGLLRAAMTPLELMWGTDNMFALVESGLLGSFFLSLGTAAIYLYQQKAVGKVGFVGFLLTAIGHMVIACLVMSTIFVLYVAKAPQLFENIPSPVGEIRMAGLIILSLGQLLLGIATVRANMLPRWAGVLLILSVFLPFLPIPALGEYLAFIWGISYAGLGAAIWAKSLEKEADATMKA